MGFVNAIKEIGEINTVSGWEAYLKYPLDSSSVQTKKGEEPHKVIRIWLDIEDPNAGQLEVKGVTKVDLVDYKMTPDMKFKYLYRDPVGANVFWAFNPLFKAGKPKSSMDKRKEMLVGEDGDWEKNNGSFFNKLKYRRLIDYEKNEFLSEGSTDRIMSDLEDYLNKILELFEGKSSFLIIFGVESNGEFLYPGDVPVFVTYFKDKLEQHVLKKSGPASEEISCFCCGSLTEYPVNLDKVFKFSTFDQVSPLPGINKNNTSKVHPLCQGCLEKITTGRETVERDLTDKSTIYGINIWAIPEVILGRSKDLEKAMERINTDDKAAGEMGAEGERRFFNRLARHEAGFVFHFLFWELDNAQERVHLMIEDVPPTQLALLEKAWKETFEKAELNWGNNASGMKTLDTALRTLYSSCIALSGTSEDDQRVMKDFVINLIGKMLMGQQINIEPFKTMFVRRIPKLIFDSTNWSHVSFTARRAQVIVTFLELVNKEVAAIENGSNVS